MPSSNYKGNNLANVAAYNWNKSNQNTWSLSNLNKINLNKNFITNIGADWAAKIAETTWKVGGNTWANIGTQPAKTAYQNEVVKPVPGSTSSNGETEHPAKIGLMYASDYGFAAAPSAWTANLNTYNGEARSLKMLIGCIWSFTNGLFPVMRAIRPMRSLWITPAACATAATLAVLCSVRVQSSVSHLP